MNNNQETMQTIKQIFSKKAVKVIFIGIAVVLAGFYFYKSILPKLLKPGKAPVSYVQGYRLVEEKISQSAEIAINLPKEIDQSIAQQNVVFEPEIQGEWLVSSNPKQIIFKPNEKLKLNRYYSVKLAVKQSPETFFTADFLAVEDPEITAVFPQENSETSEYSEITIVFNRPMVPLTTLTELEERDVPVEISPQTEGRFKWITTRNLQFLPKERLQRSSNYTVKIKDGLSSMDNLPLKGKEIYFTTRNLRYLSKYGSTGYTRTFSQPVIVSFNQPVDLERTKSEMSLRDNKTGQTLPFVVEYQQKPGISNKKDTQGRVLEQSSFSQTWQGIWQGADLLLGKASRSIKPIALLRQDKKEEDSNVNRAILEVYNAKDRFNRQKLWDFNNSYTLTIKKAYPVEGDINLNQAKIINFNVPDIIKEISALSERTSYADYDFFDPQGKLIIDFYEDIDLARTNILSQKTIKKIEYGEKCKDEESYYYYGSSDCEKTENKKRVLITFDAQEVGFSDSFNLNFERVVNTSGLFLNQAVITKTITSFPKFQVLRTSPENTNNAKLTKFIICSNTPILQPEKQDFDKYFKASPDYELYTWYSSRRDYSGLECKAGEFQTEIEYGLMPLSDYLIELNIEDVFSQKQSYHSEFSTGPMPSKNMSFYHYQDIYNVGPEKQTQLTFAVKNMTYVNLEICKLEPSRFLYYLEKKPDLYASLSVISGCKQVIRDVISLPEKYWVRNVFKVNLKDYFDDVLGNYVLTFYHPSYTKSDYDYYTRKDSIIKPVYERSYLTLTNLAVAEKKIESSEQGYSSGSKLTKEQIGELKNIYWVQDTSTLEPIEGAKVQLYQEKYSSPSRSSGDLQMVQAGAFYTNEQGIALADVVYGSLAAVITKDRDSTVIPLHGSSLNYVQGALSAKKIYIYTDKPLYMPSQEVFVKGIYRLGYDGNYEFSLNKKITVTLRDSRYEEIAKKELSLSDFGTFDTSFILPSDSFLGNYSVCADNNYACSYFDIQEYVPAAFEVKVSSDKKEYISKDKAYLDIEANYYFGVNLEGGEVSYTLSSQDYFFSPYAYRYYDYYYDISPYYSDKFLLRGTADLNENGKARIVLDLDFEKLFKKEEERVSKLFVADITVKNPQGQTISAQKSFIVHQAEFSLLLNPEKPFLAKNEKTNLKIKSQDTQEKDIGVKNAALALYKTSWVVNRRMGSDGHYYPQWEKKREVIKEYHFDIDKNGNFSQEVSFEKEGEYEAEVKAKDKRGNIAFDVLNFYVYGDQAIQIKPPDQESQIEIEAEKQDLEVGDIGRVIIKSPHEDTKALITLERGRIFEYYIKEIKGNLASFEFEVKEDYLPNVYLSVVSLSKEPKVRLGFQEFKINTKQKKIDIEVKTNKNFYLPGEEVVLDISAKDYKGEGVFAEVSLAVVDLSVLALKGNPQKNPLVFFYGGFPLTVKTSSNIYNIFEEITPELEKIFAEAGAPTKGGGGGGGAADETLARKKRGVFKETAFWQGQVLTGQDGKAQIKFTLPDNLTTWQAEALGVSKDTKLGVGYADFTSQKDLMVVPLKPRFVVPGDQFFVGVKVFNQTNKKQKLEVGFESQTLVLLDKNSKKDITLNQNETQTIYFEVKAKDEIEQGLHQFVVFAKNKDFEDTVEQTIAITPNNTFEAVATANYTSEQNAREYVFLPDNIVKNKGALTLNTSATLAVFLSDGLNYLLGYPYGCSEQIASRLKAIAIVKEGLNIPNLLDTFKLKPVIYDGREYTLPELVDIGLAGLYRNQAWDGGFSYWGGDKGSFFLTLHVAETLLALKEAGFSIRDNVLNNALKFVYSELTNNENIYRSKNNVILAVYTLFQFPSYRSNQTLNSKINDIVQDDLFLKEQISNNSLAILSMVMSQGSFGLSLQKKVFDTLDNRIDIDSRGAFLETNNKAILWYCYETSIKNTALYLKSLAISKRDVAVQDKVLRWLLRSRDKDNAWGSTNSTLAVVDGFTEFLKWKRETESDFVLDVQVENQEKLTFDFNKDTILNQYQKVFLLSSFVFNHNNTIEFSKQNRNNLANSFYYDLGLKYYLNIAQIGPRDEGFSITREFYDLNDKENKTPLSEARVGEVVRGHLQITVPSDRNFVLIEDYIPAGMELVNMDLATEQKSLRLQEIELKGRELYPDYEEFRNDRLVLYEERLSPGVYEFDYFVRPLIKGVYSQLPAAISEMYFPENFGRTQGRYFEVK